MKKIIYYIGTYLFSVIAFSSCQSDEDVTGQKEIGYMAFDVSVDHNPEIIVTRAAVADVDTFKVEITGNEYYKKFNSYAELKASGVLELKAGEYTVKAYSTEEKLKPVSTYPTYTREVPRQIITGGLTTSIEIECVMREIEIGLDLSQLLDENVNVTGLRAYIYSGATLLHEFWYEEGGNGITDTRYFDPNEPLEILLEGNYEGWELGDLGKGLFIRDAENPDGGKIDVKGNVSLTVTIGIKPDDTPQETEMAQKQPISFNLQTTAVQ